MNVDNSARPSRGRAETRLSPAELNLREDNGYNIPSTPRVKTRQEPARRQLPSLRALATRRRKHETERGDCSLTTIETTSQRRRRDERSDTDHAGRSTSRRAADTLATGAQAGSLRLSLEGGFAAIGAVSLCCETVIDPRKTPQSRKTQFDAPQRVGRPCEAHTNAP